VPLVFHCTTADRIPQIFEDGELKPGRNGAVSFTEIPIGELDRMKYRHRGAEQVAIGFPRRYVESLGLTPVWYLKYNPAAAKLLASLKEHDLQAHTKLAPFVDETGDVSPFQEVRTTLPVKIEEAVWILTTKRVDGSPYLDVSAVKTFQTRYGQISRSYWHRSHQMGMLGEWQFTSFDENDEGIPQGFRFMGEHYWRQHVTEQKELDVRLPEHEKRITFDVTKSGAHAQLKGPWRFIDMARLIANALINAGESLDSALPYRMIAKIETA
jgi:hypothetical protein